jgi:amidase
MGKTAVANLEQFFEKYDQWNDAVNAVLFLRDRDELMAEAEAADRVDTADRGMLHGEVIAVKDLANAKDLPTTMGSPLFKGVIAGQDDLFVARMRAAGAIIVGKTNTPEFGLGSHTFNPVNGTTYNPYDRRKSAGGSSGGAAVALATGMMNLTDGSDMMGSLRNPAGWNNVYGYRPTWGLVPTEPLGETFLHQLATMGPMGRSPRDVARLLSVQAGPDPRQPHGIKGIDYATALKPDLKGKKIGWLENWGGAYPCEPGILEKSEESLDQMRALGAIVEEVAPPFDASEIWQSWITLRSWAVAGGTGVFYHDPEKRKLLKPESVWEIERGLALSAMDVHQASLIRSNWFKKAAQLFEKYDAMILPSAQVWPFDAELRHPVGINGIEMDTYHRWMEVVIPIGLLGLPCLNIPAGFGDNGMPLGLQLFGPRGSDSALLNMGEAWHQETDWPNARPPQL